MIPTPNPLEAELNRIKDTDILVLTCETLDAAPKCFWSMPASTTGKYHPAISLGEGGLIRHTLAVCYFTRTLLEWAGVPAEDKRYSLALAAAILHDCCKKGDEDKYTAFDHPLRAAELIRHRAKVNAEFEVSFIEPADLDTLCGIVSAHMGRWNTDPKYHPDITLPTPLTGLQRLVATADYLASRKDITLAMFAGQGENTTTATPHEH